jgi:hypothetical protein
VTIEVVELCAMSADESCAAVERGEITLEQLRANTDRNIRETARVIRDTERYAERTRKSEELLIEMRRLESKRSDLTLAHAPKEELDAVDLDLDLLFATHDALGDEQIAHETEIAVRKAKL